MPQAWGERHPALSPLAACTACESQLQWEAERLPCISLQQPSESSLPAWYLVLAASLGKVMAKASILPVLGKETERKRGRKRRQSPFSELVGWPQTGFHTHLILDCLMVLRFLPPQGDPGLGTSGPKVLKKRAGVNSYTGGCCRGRKHLRPILFPE